jgi:hypothetical protein
MQAAALRQKRSFEKAPSQFDGKTRRFALNRRYNIDMDQRYPPQRKKKIPMIACGDSATGRRRRRLNDF